MIRWIQADIFTIPGVIVVPTNTKGVHGAGLAKEALLRNLITPGRGEFDMSPLCGGEGPEVITFPTKFNWWEKADIELIKDSFQRLAKVVDLYYYHQFKLPLVGLGHGEADIEIVVPMIKEFAEAHKNVIVVLPVEAPKYAGKSCSDNSLAKLDEIKKLLGV